MLRDAGVIADVCSKTGTFYKCDMDNFLSAIDSSLILKSK